MSHVLIALLLTPAADSAAADTRWGILEIGGQPAGYQFHDETPKVGGVLTEDVMRLSVKRFGQAFEMTTRLELNEGLGGRLDGFSLTISNGGQVVQTMTGRRDGEVMVVKQKKGGQQTEERVALPDGTLSPSAPDRALLASPPKPGEVRRYDVFVPETLGLATVTVTGAGKKSTTLRDGSKAERTAIEVTRSDLPIASTFWFADDGAPVRSDMGLMQLVSWPATRVEALAAVETPSVDLGLKTIVTVAPQPGLTQAAAATYDIGGLKSALPETPFQKTVSEKNGEFVVLVRRVNLRAYAGIGESADAALASTRWLDWDSPDMAELVKEAPAKQTSAGETAAALERYVRRAITRTSFGVGFASAGEVARSREGDCTEHAVLLAALLRSRGIPSRVSFGLVYSPGLSALVPHMWTEACLTDSKGQTVWVPQDATRPMAGTGAGHLKFGDSLLDSDAALPMTELLRLSQELDTLKVRIR